MMMPSPSCSPPRLSSSHFAKTQALQTEPTRTTLLAFNDFHKQFNQAPALIATMNKLRSEAEQRNEDVFCFSGGDNNAGGNKQHWKPLVQLLNHMQLNATVLGNHDFDSGLKPLLEGIKASTFPWLCSNFEVKTQELASEDRHLIQETTRFDRRTEATRPNAWVTGKHVIHTEKGNTYGVIGVTTPATKHVTGDDHLFNQAVEVMAFKETVKRVQQQVDELEAKGINKIVALSHLGFHDDGNPQWGSDLELAKQVQGLDVIIGGHTHTETKTVNEALSQGKDKMPVLITQAGQNGLFVSKTTLLFDKEGHIVVTPEEHPEVLLHTTKNATPDVKAQKMIQDNFGEQTPLMKLDKTYTPFAMFQQETPLGNFIADKYLEWAVKEHQIDVAMVMPPTIKMAAAQELTPLGLQGMLPYSNNQLFEVKGEALLGAFKTSAEWMHKYHFENHQGKPPQMTETSESPPTAKEPYLLHPSGNLRAKLDAVTKQVVSLDIADARSYLEGKQPEFKAIDPQKTYRLAFNSFPIGDNVRWYPSLMGMKPISKEFALAQELTPLLKAQFAGLGPQTLKTDGRLAINYG